MKYCIGTVVRVRSNLIIGKEYGGVYFSSGMTKFLGSFL